MDLTTDAGDGGLAHERTSLAWERTGIAFFVTFAALGRRVWPIDEGNHAAVVAVLGVAALTVVAALVLAPRLHPRASSEGTRIQTFRLVTASTLVLAIAGGVLALSPT